jgi:hypothetical protein
MKCCRCSRPIFNTPAATVKTRRGVMAYGPKCARLMGLTEVAARSRAIQATPKRRKTANETQLELELEAEEATA